MGASLGEVIAFGEEAAGKLAELENRDARLAELEKEQTMLRRSTGWRRGS